VGIILPDWETAWQAETSSDRSIEEELNKRFQPCDGRKRGDRRDAQERFKPLIERILFDQIPLTLEEFFAMARECPEVDRLFVAYMRRFFWNEACTNFRGLKLGTTMRQENRGNQIRNEAKRLENVFFPKKQVPEVVISLGTNEEEVNLVEKHIHILACRKGGESVDGSREYYDFLTQPQGLEIIIEAAVFAKEQFGITPRVLSANPREE
jgi:hypothetical protein